MGKRTQVVAVRTPGNEPVEHVELEEGQQLLIGRSPDLDRVEGAGSAGQTKLLQVRSPSVSANHARVRHDSDGIHIADLASRNGTLLTLPRSSEVRTSAGTEPLELRLAPSLRLEE